MKLVKHKISNFKYTHVCVVLFTKVCCYLPIYVYLMYSVRKIAAKNYILIIIPYAYFVAVFYGSGSRNLHLKFWNPLPSKVVFFLNHENNTYFKIIDQYHCTTFYKIKLHICHTGEWGLAVALWPKTDLLILHTIKQATFILWFKMSQTIDNSHLKAKDWKNWEDLMENVDDMKFAASVIQYFKTRFGVMRGMKILPWSESRGISKSRDSKMPAHSHLDFLNYHLNEWIFVYTNKGKKEFQWIFRSFKDKFQLLVLKRCFLILESWDQKAKCKGHYMEGGRVLVNIMQPFKVEGEWDTSNTFRHRAHTYEEHIKENWENLQQNFINRWPTLTKSLDYLGIIFKQNK